MTYKQYRVTLEGEIQVNTPDGKFVPLPPEPDPAPAPDDQNGNNTPHELEWYDNPPLVPRPEPQEDDK